MRDWQLIVPLLQSWLDQWATLLSKVPEAIPLAAILLPVVLAIFSKRLIVVLGCILLAVIAFCAFVAPANVANTLATGIYLASLVIAVSGIVAPREARVLQAEIASLRLELNQLQVREGNRFMRELTSSTKELSASGNPSASTPYVRAADRPANAAGPAAEPCDDVLTAGAMSIADIDKLMGELQTGRDYLQSEGERVRQLTARYAHLVQTASASVKIIVESMGKWRNLETVSQAPVARPLAPPLSPVADAENAMPRGRRPKGPQ